MFALGLQPTGSKDPFALRRQANGIVKIIADHNLPLDTAVLFRVALAGYKGSPAEQKFIKPEDYEKSISAFLRERLEFYLRDVRGFAYDEVNAVLAAGSDRVTDVLARAHAVAEVRKSPDFEPISVAFKRIKNILRQAAESGKTTASQYSASISPDPAEKQLAEAVNATAPRVAELRKKRDYAGALAQIAKLRPALDTFFEKVMVMVDDENVRANRLALLTKMLSDFSTIADFSEIVTQSDKK
jgi:glycyl-tRNA synthetase beta chain